MNIMMISIICTYLHLYLYIHIYIWSPALKIYLKGIPCKRYRRWCFQPIWRNILANLEVFPMDQANGISPFLLGSIHLQSGSIFQPAMLDDPGVYQTTTKIMVTLVRTLLPKLTKATPWVHSHRHPSPPCWNTRCTRWRVKWELIPQLSHICQEGLGNNYWRGHVGMRITPFRSHEIESLVLLGSKTYDLVHCCGLLGSKFDAILCRQPAQQVEAWSL